MPHNFSVTIIGQISFSQNFTILFCDRIEKKQSFYELSNYFMLRLNKKISPVILDDTKNNDNRI